MSQVQSVDQELICHDCGALPGEYHKEGCDVERCPRCGGQYMLCNEGGCEGTRPGEDWPPALDDRMVWTGEWPGVQECREFGWYVDWPTGVGSTQLTEDLNKLTAEAEWDRLDKRYVRTTLTQSILEMEQRGLIRTYGNEGVTAGKPFLVHKAMYLRGRGVRVNGYFLLSLQQRWRKQTGKNFDLRFGSLSQDCSTKDIGQLICECLTKFGVKHTWDGESTRIRVISDSITKLPVSNPSAV